ncbi:MAG: hypothetical protein DVB22_003162 [Verrucomicrobia bacterium]|nr:MAG: hypothetical protein DVB22_003162 [Verrucomicrobiota bacterium]
MRLLALLLIPALASPLSAQSKSPPRTTASPEIPKPDSSVPKRSSSSSSSQDLDAALKARIESFFSLLREERTSAAYQKLFEGSFVGEEDKELLQQLTDVTDDILEACGKLDSTELLSVNSAGRTVREIVYAVNFRKRPVRWRLYAYLSEGRWQIVDTSVNPDITAFFHDEIDPPHQPVPDKSEK